MEPFTHLIVIFKAPGSGDQFVRMAHPMIAEQGTLSLQNAGMHKSAIALDLLNGFCEENITPSVTHFVKDLLTKRQTNNGEKGLFSQLILDIETQGGLVHFNGQQSKHFRRWDTFLRRFLVSTT